MRRSLRATICSKEPARPRYSIPVLRCKSYGIRERRPCPDGTSRMQKVAERMMKGEGKKNQNLCPETPEIPDDPGVHIRSHLQGTRPGKQGQGLDHAGIIHNIQGHAGHDVRGQPSWGSRRRLPIASLLLGGVFVLHMLGTFTYR